MKIKLKNCKCCGVKPVVEKWWSGSFKCAVRCTNPDRGDECDMKFYHSMSNDLDDAIRKWNEVN